MPGVTNHCDLSRTEKGSQGMALSMLKLGQPQANWDMVTLAGPAMSAATNRQFGKDTPWQLKGEDSRRLSQARTASPCSDFSEKYEAARVNLHLVSYDFPSVQARTHAHTPHTSLPLLVCLKARQPGPSNTPLCLFEQHNLQEILEPLITHRAHRNFSSLPPHLRRQKGNFTP